MFVVLIGGFEFCAKTKKLGVSGGSGIDSSNNWALRIIIMYYTSLIVQDKFLFEVLVGLSYSSVCGTHRFEVLIGLSF